MILIGDLIEVPYEQEKQYNWSFHQTMALDSPSPNLSSP